MDVVYFTERPHRGIAEEEILAHGSYFGLPNERFDPARASSDYNYYFDEYLYAEELGFDGVALNEHHGNAFCMGSVLNIEAAVLARITKRVKIYLIGNPIPAHRNPLRLAEELAEIDLISRGRLVAGWLRGSGPEQIFNNVNPAYNREMFEEAHDFILRAWTTPGPWRYEGTHFHYRHVNPWALPLQKPYPPTIIPGVLSTETAFFAADRDYPYLGLATSLGPTASLWNAYADRYAERGLQAGSENFGYVTHVYVDKDPDRAQEIGRNFLYAHGNGNFAKAQHTLPAGYNSIAAIKRLAQRPGKGWLGINRDKLMGNGSEPEMVDMPAERAQIDATFAEAQQNMTMVIGTPDEVLRKLKISIEVLRPGVLFCFNVQGDVSDEDRRSSMRLLAEEVLPELRAHADSLGLKSMFDRRPGTTKLSANAIRADIVDLAPLQQQTA